MNGAMKMAVGALGLVGLVIGGWWAAQSQFDARYASGFDLKVLNLMVIAERNETRRGLSILEIRVLEAEHRNARRKKLELDGVKARRPFLFTEQALYEDIANDIEVLRQQIEYARKRIPNQ